MRASGLLRSYLKVTGHGVPIFWRKKGAIPFNIFKTTLKDMVFKRIENEVLVSYLDHEGGGNLIMEIADSRWRAG